MYTVCLYTQDVQGAFCVCNEKMIFDMRGRFTVFLEDGE